MVVSETIIAVMIIRYGVKRSYRIALNAEKLIRRTILRQPRSALSSSELYNSLPRRTLRHVFKAGMQLSARLAALRDRIFRFTPALPPGRAMPQKASTTPPPLRPKSAPSAHENAAAARRSLATTSSVKNRQSP
mmetsp:Transcript_4638/g.12524  ORF Transcript_4638/g.12524 Transcript_4638/m.12524 type:complete len:134 (+) Transcript_4638:105-506(+)